MIFPFCLLIFRKEVGSVPFSSELILIRIHCPPPNPTILLNLFLLRWPVNSMLISSKVNSALAGVDQWVELWSAT